MLTKITTLLCLGLTTLRAQQVDNRANENNTFAGSDETGAGTDMDWNDWENQDWMAEGATWEQDWDKEWQTAQDYGNNMDLSGDWFGAIVNNPCAPTQQVSDCGQGEMCVVQWFTDPCTNERWCEQSVTFDFENYETADCTNGTVVFNQTCEVYCEYVDCGEDHSGDDVCWMEICDDGCGLYNCSLWYQLEGEWYGEYCPEEEMMFDLPELRLGDAMFAIMRAGKMYEGTVEQVFDTFCSPDDQECLKGKDQLVGFFNGQIPAQEPVPAEQTMFMSQAIGQAVMNATAAMQQAIDAYVAPTLDGVLGNQQADQVMETFLQDTQSGLEQGGNPDEQMDVNALQAFVQADNTDQIVQGFASQLTVENLLGLVVENVPEDSPVNEWLSFFTEGQQNAGTERMGARDEQQP